MRTIIDVVSVWEFSHRYYNADPNTTDPRELPLNVQDMLRTITKLMFNHQISAFSEQGTRYKNYEDVISYDKFDPHFSDEQLKTLSEDALEDLKYDAYEGMKAARARRHNEKTKNFEQCFRSRIYNKQELEDVYLYKYEISELCDAINIPLPSFWFTDEEVRKQNNSQSKTNSGRHAASNEDKSACRETAASLWNEHPTYTIVQIIEHPDIQIGCSGKLYTEKTIRGWIKELDPRSPEERRGRPKKTT